MAYFRQAIKWMEQGKKIKREKWDDLTWLYLDTTGGQDNHKIKGDSPGTMEFLGYHSFIADDWEIREEPKETLSDNIMNTEERGYDVPNCIPVGDVKEFIQQLKQRVKDKQIETFIEDIDELVGDKLK